MVSADELGEMGQARFKEICAAAGLICNQSNRDRTGWDFIVEFPFANTASMDVETRQTPLSCHVQVKTLLERNDRFEMRLSSAERLAKELKPAFVYVFKVNEGWTFTEAYVVHVLDKPLEKILKRLRKLDVAGKPAVNKSTISMSTRSDGAMTAPTARALREALSAAIGGDLHAYAEKKRKQLATLGFEERPFSGQMTLHLSNREELLDVFLGIKKDVPFSDIYTQHTRFGIARPVPELSGKSGTIRINPNSVDTCTITVRRNPTLEPVVFKGKVFLPPPVLHIPDGPRKIRFVTNLFSVTVAANPTGARWSVEGSNVDILETPTVWSAYWRLACILALGEGTISIASDNHPIDLTFNIPRKVITLDVEECRPWVWLCEQLSSVYRFVGVVNEPLLKMQSIADSADNIAAVYCLIHPEGGTLGLSFPLEAEDKETAVLPPNFDVLYANFFELGGVTIAYCALAHMIRVCTERRIEYRSEGVALMNLTQLRALPEQYEQMIAAAVSKSGCENIFRANFAVAD
jgi:hypothetical protein